MLEIVLKVHVRDIRNQESAPETRRVRRARTGTAQTKTGCIISERISTMLGCDVDRE